MSKIVPNLKNFCIKRKQGRKETTCRIREATCKQTFDKGLIFKISKNFDYLNIKEARDPVCKGISKNASLKKA